MIDYCKLAISDLWVREGIDVIKESNKNGRNAF